MKKLIAIVLAALTVLSFSTVAFAADTTTLTTTVPDATYTLNIPADQEITFGKTVSDIGKVTVANSSGFAEGKNLQVTLTYDNFKADGVSTTIPYFIYLYGSWYNSGVSPVDSGTMHVKKESGSSLIFKGKASGECGDMDWGKTEFDTRTLRVEIDSTDWGKALGGEYSSTITFTAEVVSES